VGKEKEAILEMLPYIRLGYISDSAEMNSVISSQGAICPVSKHNALCFLSLIVQSRYIFSGLTPETWGTLSLFYYIFSANLANCAFKQK
jgi:hypothetical protein